jgi:hypothetical protein
MRVSDNDVATPEILSWLAYSELMIGRPILTYGKQGCRKLGVKASKNGIVHSVGQKPVMLRNEPKLGFKPVRVEMTAKWETLSPQSRVNYSKIMSVERNVKVFFIGSILYDDWDIVLSAVNEC